MNKPKVICVMGKSGSGKSTVINNTVKLLSDFYAVKSYTTRKPRENDPEDIKTHRFVSKECLDRDEENKQVISKYHSDKGYYSWTTHSCFKEDKINLYAIDPIACLDFISKYSDTYDIHAIYIYIDEPTRLKRLSIRDGITELPEEPHLDFSHLEPLYETNRKPKIVIGFEGKKETLIEFISTVTKCIVEDIDI